MGLLQHFLLFEAPGRSFSRTRYFQCPFPEAAILGEKEGICVSDQSNNNETKIIDALFSDSPAAEKKPRSSGRRYNRSRTRKPAAESAQPAEAPAIGLVIPASENQQAPAETSEATKAPEKTTRTSGRRGQRRTNSRAPKTAKPATSAETPEKSAERLLRSRPAGAAACPGGKGRTGKSRSGKECPAEYRQGPGKEPETSGADHPSGRA